MCTIANEATQHPTSGLDNDIPTFPASLVKFDGANYLLWSQSMLLAIGSVDGGEYVGYLTGMKKKPNSGETLVARWTQEDSFVKSYLIYHMTPEIATRYMIVDTAAEIWTSVKERYSTSRNGARIFELQKKIREHKQEGTTVTHYYATLCSMYQELDVYQSGKYQKFDSTVVPKLQKLEDEDRLFTFLTGLSGAYKKVIQEILMRDPLPTLQQAFQLVSQERTGQGMVSSSIEHSALPGSTSAQTPGQIVRLISPDRMFQEGILVNQENTRQNMATSSTEHSALLGSSSVQTPRQIVRSISPDRIFQEALLVNQENTRQNVVTSSTERSALPGSSNVQTPRQIVRSISPDRMFQEGILVNQENTRQNMVTSSTERSALTGSSNVQTSRQIVRSISPDRMFQEGNFRVLDLTFAKGKGAAKRTTEASLKAVENRKVGKRKAASEAVGGTSKAKGGKAAKELNKPNRPWTAFFVFLEDFRKTFKIENPNVTASAIGKAGAAKWTSMSAAEKAPYEAKSSKMKSYYEELMDESNKKHDDMDDDVDEESDRSKSEADEESGVKMSINPKQLVNPGPDDFSLLYRQENHISQFIWRGEERDKLDNIGGNFGISQWVLNDRQKQLVREAGFGFCLKASNVIRTDVAFLNALFERWRPETNTFHLPVGECTITLEDVKFILGLPITGLPVTNHLLRGRQKHYFRTALNITKEAVSSSGVRLTWLRGLFAKPKGQLTEEQEDSAVAAFLLDCIGSVILPNKGKSYIHAKYLTFVGDVRTVGNYSWGSACLSNTYRELTNATNMDAKNFCGCHSLIQIWAWERISIARPVPRPDSEFQLPRVLAYRYGKDDPYKRRHSKKNLHLVPVTFYRWELDRFLDYHHFTWDPYERFFQLQENIEFIQWRELARTRLPLIHFDCVEYQLPERVMRQFGLLLEIPRNPPCFDELRATKEDFERVDAKNKYAKEVEQWGTVGVDGHVNPVKNDHGTPCSLETYMSWYRKVTRRRIHPIVLSKTTGYYEPGSVFSANMAPFQAKATKKKPDYHKLMNKFNKKQDNMDDDVIDVDEESDRSKSEADEESGQDDGDGEENDKNESHD